MKVFTVSQINRIIKDLIDNEIVLEDVSVSGELSSFSVTRNIAYFTLKDNDNMLQCMQFNSKQQFNVGDMVECRGNIKYYEKGGKLTFNVLNISLSGEGELYKKFLELKSKLEKEGLFDDFHKIPIPKYINSIGVITSKTGAVLQDIRNVTSRRNPNLDIYVYDAQVQGRYAVQDVIEGINYFDNYSDVDVIIVARGGGSLEDLMPFNDEQLARMAYICNKPLISAVGHETDFSILDFVADLRAPTPSAAAELVSYDTTEMIRYVNELRNIIYQKVNENYNNVEYRLNFVIADIDKAINDKISNEMININSKLNVLDNNIERIITNTTHRVNLSINTLDKLNPIRLLKAGYSVVTNKDEYINFKNTKVGDSVNIRTADAKFNAKILDKEKL